MATVFAGALVFALAVVAMALGRLMGGAPLRGSCGGTGGPCACDPAAARDCQLRRHVRPTRSSS